MKKGDYIVILIILLIAGVVFTYTNKKNIEMHDEYALEVEINVDGEEYATYSLMEDKILDIKTEYGTNTISIKNGEVKMKSSDCDDHICEHMKAISRPGENIICLPHRLVITIVGEDSDNEVDVVIH